MRTGIVYMVATVLCIFVTSCFTGVESTKKITMPDTGEIAAQSPEDRFIESYFVQQGCEDPGGDRSVEIYTIDTSVHRYR